MNDKVLYQSVSNPLPISGKLIMPNRSLTWSKERHPEYTLNRPPSCPQTGATSVFHVGTHQKLAAAYCAGETFK